MADSGPVSTAGPEFKNIFNFEPLGGRSVLLEKRIVKLRIAALEKVLTEARLAYDAANKQGEAAADTTAAISLLDRVRAAGVALDKAERLVTLAEKNAKERGLLEEQVAPAPRLRGSGMAS